MLKLDFANYHPFFLSSNHSKIFFKKSMQNRLYKFLNDNNVIYHLQLSFREKHSTSFELIHLTETIKEALDQGK